MASKRGEAVVAGWVAESPLYVAVIECVPTLRLLIVNVALPPDTGTPEARVAPLSRKFTVPCTTWSALTAAEKVTELPWATFAALVVKKRAEFLVCVFMTWAQLPRKNTAQPKVVITKRALNRRRAPNIKNRPAKAMPAASVGAKRTNGAF